MLRLRFRLLLDHGVVAHIRLWLVVGVVVVGREVGRRHGERRGVVVRRCSAATGAGS